MKKINKVYKNKIIIAMSLAFSSSAYSITYPDSTNTNLSMGVSISHNINGEKIGGNQLIKTTYGKWSSWETTSYMDNCTDWSPKASEIEYGKIFIQTTLCDAEETRTRDVTYHYEDGTTRTITEYDSVITKVDDEQEAVGEKNQIVRESIEYSEWKENSNPYGCSSWTPSVFSIDEGVPFDQNRSCYMDYTRTETVYQHYASGDKKVKSSSVAEKTDTVSESRSMIGKKQGPLTWKYSRVTRVFVSTDPSFIGVGSRIEGTPCSEFGATRERIKYVSTGAQVASGFYLINYEELQYKCM